MNLTKYLFLRSQFKHCHSHVWIIIPLQQHLVKSHLFSSHFTSLTKLVSSARECSLKATELYMYKRCTPELCPSEMVSVFQGNVTAHLGGFGAKRKCNIFAQQYQLFHQTPGWARVQVGILQMQPAGKNSTTELRFWNRVPFSLNGCEPITNDREYYKSR